MKTVFLLRHAKSSWKDPGLADFDRPLNKRGKSSAKAIGAHMAAEGIVPDLVLCSAAKRTRSTLKRVRGAFGEDIETVVDDAFYHAGTGDWMRYLLELGNEVGSAMIIGHNPGMEELAHHLIGGGDEDAHGRLCFKYPTGALAVLTVDIPHWRALKRGSARLVSFTCPRDLDAEG
ncbi:MAG: histidine phosphatase family protein [Rhodospirillales bacterium]|nr:histidine phosphatase family protein [Rhodospirillales bacterium]